MLEKEEIESSILRMKEAAREGQPVRADVYLIHINHLEHRLELAQAREQLYKDKQTPLADPAIYNTSIVASTIGRPIYGIGNQFNNINKAGSIYWKGWDVGGEGTPKP